MQYILIFCIGLASVVVALSVAWRYLVRVRNLPCPSWGAWVLELDFMEKRAGQAATIDEMELGPGMRVVDVGCGPGRLTFRVAERVLPDGEVVALDVQERMLDRLQNRMVKLGVTNVHPLHAGAGEGKLPKGHFDRALLVTVLGEIPDRARALQEIYGALKIGGVLVVTEIIPDPHYQRVGTVKAMAESAGFRVGQVRSTLFSYTIRLHKEG